MGITPQFTELAEQLKAAVVAEIPNVNLNPTEYGIITQATQTVADCSLRLVTASDSEKSVLNARLRLAKASLEDVLAAKMQDATAASTRVRNQFITLSTAFLTKLVEVGLTAVLTAA